MSNVSKRMEKLTGCCKGITTLLYWMLIFCAGLVINITPSFAGAGNAPPRQIDPDDRVVLGGNVHPLARPEFDIGTVGIDKPMERIVLSLKLNPAGQTELEQFLSDQQNPSSPDYHHWLTPEGFGKRFGTDPADIAVVSSWLTSQGFTIDEVARGGTWVNFSGTVGQVERAFRVEIHNYLVNGLIYQANSSDPSIPRGLSDLVLGIVSLHNFPKNSMITQIKTLGPAGAQPQPLNTNSDGSHDLYAGDFATIYNVAPLYAYASGINGTGQSIAIVGRTHPSTAVSDWAAFRSMMGLSPNAPQIIVNGPDPGDLGSNEDGEADLDVEWSGAVATNATIKFVTSASTSTTDGVDLSAQYIVNNDVAPVMSVSFGLGECALGSSENAFINNLWAQAAALGISVFVASGDSGADGGCRRAPLGVSGLASTPYNVAVGGTEFNEGSGTYWASTNNATGSSALSYIPEVGWNESSTGGGASGGGVSGIYSKPDWQAAPGVPTDGKRDVPDVSLTAAGHDYYVIVTQGSVEGVAGTSCSSPSFAGIMALIVQATGESQGNANVRLYQLGNAQYGSEGAAVFHDITSGNNSGGGVTGYSCGPGYDLVTGLGSVDAYALTTNWGPWVPQPPGPPTGVIASAGNATGYVSFNTAANGGSPITGYTVTSSPAGGVDMNSGSTLLSHTMTGLTNGTYYTFTVTATNSVGTGGPSQPSNVVVPEVSDAVTFNQFSVPTSGAFQSYSSDTVEDSNGNIWFTESQADKIGIITPSGTITQFQVPTANSLPNYITSGPDGNLWFTEDHGNNVGRITPSGSITEYPVAGAGELKGITAGADGNLWFADYDVARIGRITTSGAILGFFTSSFGAEGITLGPDNNIWFAGGSQIEGMTSSGGLIGPFTVPACDSGGAYRITSADGYLWFTNGDCIEQMTTSGGFTTYNIPTSDSGSTFIVPGPDGNIWFSESSANKIGMITPSGTITEFAVPATADRPWGLAAGPGNTLWFDSIAGNEMGELSLSLVARMLAGAAVGTYSSLQTAYNACMGGDTINMQATTFTENPDLNLNVAVLLSGGYNSAFSSQVGFTTVQGTMTISAGTVTVQNIVIE